MSDSAVRVVDLVKTFADVTALDGVSLAVEPGIVYGLLGPNGAGKTTIIRVLTTLLRPDSGSAQVAGIDVLADPVTARTKIGLAGQYAAVDEYLTGWENIVMVGRLYDLDAPTARRRAREVLERIHLSDAADRPVKTYSGGMRRRLDLAASMVGRPQVLFLDEPTTGIDPRSRIDIWELIEDMTEEGTTILLTTQYLEEADRLAARIGVIDRGHLIIEGTADELKDRIGGAVVEISVPAAEAAFTASSLQRATGEQPTLEGGGQMSIPATRGAQTLLEAVRTLDGAGITPQDVVFRKPTLNDVFLTLTGHAAENGENANGGAETDSARRRRRNT